MLNPFGGLKKSVADGNSEERVVVVVFDVSFQWVTKGGLVMLDFILHASDVILEVVCLFGVGHITLLNCGSQSFGKVGNQDQSDMVGSLDGLERCVRRERGGYEVRIAMHVLEESGVDLVTSCCHVVNGWDKVFGVWDWDRGRCAQVRWRCSGSGDRGLVRGVKGVHQELGKNLVTQCVTHD